MERLQVHFSAELSPKLTRCCALPSEKLHICLCPSPFAPNRKALRLDENLERPGLMCDRERLQSLVQWKRMLNQSRGSKRT